MSDSTADVIARLRIVAAHLKRNMDVLCLKHWPSEIQADIDAVNEALARLESAPALLAVGERHEAAELAQDIADAVRTESVSDITTQHLRPYEEYRQERLASEAGVARTREALTDAAKTVLRGFDEGVFVRSIDDDHNSAWAIKLMPFISALAVLAREVEPQP